MPFYDWCGVVQSKKKIRRVLDEHVKIVGVHQWSYYEQYRIAATLCSARVLDLLISGNEGHFNAVSTNFVLHTPDEGHFPIVSPNFILQPAPAS